MGFLAPLFGAAAGAGATGTAVGLGTTAAGGAGAALGGAAGTSLLGGGAATAAPAIAGGAGLPGAAAGSLGGAVPAGFTTPTLSLATKAAPAATGAFTLPGTVSRAAIGNNLLAPAAKAAAPSWLSKGMKIGGEITGLDNVGKLFSDAPLEDKIGSAMDLLGGGGGAQTQDPGIVPIMPGTRSIDSAAGGPEYLTQYNRRKQSEQDYINSLLGGEL